MLLWHPRRWLSVVPLQCKERKGKLARESLFLVDSEKHPGDGCKRRICKVSVIEVASGSLCAFSL